MDSLKYRVRARGETTKRLLAQLANEQLVKLTLLTTEESSGTIRARITGNEPSTQWITLPVVNAIGLFDHLRPNDLRSPVTLCSGGREVLDDDPGTVFEFCSAWFQCQEETKASMVDELRNSASMLEKWMALGAEMPILDINSSFLDWERSVITGHPTHPYHRTCYAQRPLEPVGSADLPRMLNPDICFLTIPRTSVRLFGAFEKMLEPLMKHLETPFPEVDGNVMVPCLSQHLPALKRFFPEAVLVKTVPNCARSQAAIRTVSVPGFPYDIKFSLACLITSALRVLPCWSAASAPGMTSLLKNLVPAELWVFGEVAAVTGSQEDVSEARYLTCILRENLESKAERNGESLIVVSALMERPSESSRTYAEILFALKTPAEKIRWFTSYIECLLPLALYPLRRHQVGFEFHSQNTVARVCKRTKAIRGFAIRDLAGIKIHGPTLEAQGFDVTKFAASSTDNRHEVWDRLHHSLIQNNIGYMLYALGLERSLDGWGIVRSVLSDVLDVDGDIVGKEIYDYFVKETMPFKCFMKMRIQATLKTSFNIVDTQIPNVCQMNSLWFRQVSLAGVQITKNLISPENVDPVIRIKEKESMQANLSKNLSPYGQVPRAARPHSPHPVILPKKFVVQVKQFHTALALALDNIIERWWKDTDAGFPSRMPLEPWAEELLKWIDKGSDEEIIRPYKGNQGNLRPDLLIPSTDDYDIPQFRVCEINGRFPITFLHYVGSSYEALAGLQWNSALLEPASDHKKLLESFSTLFNPEYPIHFVSGTANFPRDSPLFGLVEHRTGARPRSVKTASLRMVRNENSPTGFILYCLWGADPAVTKCPSSLITIDGEVLEEVHQVGMQLYDFELASLPLEMTREIALRSVNDMRSVFIAHDKRILGIIRQELDALVHKHQVLTPAQAKILDETIIPTFLPGSLELKALLEGTYKASISKDVYILKPFRQARGSGIVLGKNLSETEWCSILESMQVANVDASSPQFVLQPFLRLRSFDWFWDEERGVRKSGVLSSYYSINGQFVGLSMWRTASVSEDIISGSTKDTISVLSAVYPGI